VNDALRLDYTRHEKIDWLFQRANEIGGDRGTGVVNSMSRRSTSRVLAPLKEEGKVRRRGTGKTTVTYQAIAQWPLSDATVNGYAFSQALPAKLQHSTAGALMHRMSTYQPPEHGLHDS
jgi:hypothetical protein